MSIIAIGICDTTNKIVNKSYVNWLILLFKNTDKKTFIEDLYKATDYLTIYDKAKRNIEDERSKNIFNIKIKIRIRITIVRNTTTSF